MCSGAALSEVIAAALDADTAVEESILGTSDPEAIWARVLEVRPDAVECFHFEASVGALVGVRLADGARVAIKFHREPVDGGQLRAVQRVQGHLCANAFPCPRPQALGGAIVYARAYGARCLHALGEDARGSALREFADALL